MNRERGRPRTFELHDALDAALEVFWSRGFLSASLTELTAAMGLNKPSLYAAFGDKESLYLQALERYAQQKLAERAQLLEGANARTALQNFLVSLNELFTNPSHPGGCFIINGAADLGSDALPQAIDSALRRALHRTEEMLAARLSRAQREGELPASQSCAALTAFFMAVIGGMAVLAKGGADRSKLQQVVQTAMSTWPDDSVGRKRVPVRERTRRKSRASL